MNAILTAILKKFSSNWIDEGFTDYIKGKEKRYIIGLTNNTTKAKEWASARRVLNKKLVSQIHNFEKNFETITIGGWTDENTGIKYLDVGTAINNKKQAIALAKQYNQLAIFDTKTFETIYV